MHLAEQLEERVDVRPSAILFRKHFMVTALSVPGNAGRSRLSTFAWYVRPTLVSCTLPVIFVFAWLFLYVG